MCFYKVFIVGNILFALLLGVQVCLPWIICLAVKFSVLIIGCSLFNYISFSPFVPTKGAKALHLVQLFVVAVAAVTASC